MGEEHYKKAVLHILQAGSAIFGFDAYSICKKAHQETLLHGEGEKGEEPMRKQKEHELKTWPGFFAEVATGAKTFEIRKYDRDFQVGDVLVLQEYDPVAEAYTGHELRVVVHYSVMLDSIPGMAKGFIGMSVSVQPSPTPIRQEWEEWARHLAETLIISTRYYSVQDHAEAVENILLTMPCVPKG